MPVARNANMGSVNQFGRASLPIRTSAQLTAALNNGARAKAISEQSESAGNTKLTSDADKYQVAVSQARTELGDGASDKDLRLRTDEIYENDLGGETKASDLRGENIFTQAIRGLDEGWTDLTNTIGGGLDWAYDNTIGGLTGTQDAFSGEDIGGVIDVGTDIGLGALSFVPGVNLVAAPLLVGKNVIQESDNIYEAFTGRDATTLQKLSDGQRLSKGIGSALNVGLGSVPVIGKAVKPLTALVKGGAKATAKGATKEAASEVLPGMAAATIPRSMAKQGLRKIGQAAGYGGAGLTAGTLNRMGETGEDFDVAAISMIQDMKENPVSSLMTILGPAAGSKLLRKMPSVTGKALAADKTVLSNRGKAAAANADIKQSSIVPPVKGGKLTQAQASTIDKLAKASDDIEVGPGIRNVPAEIPLVAGRSITVPRPGRITGQELFTTKKNAPAMVPSGILKPKLAKRTNSNMKLMGMGSFGEYAEQQGEYDDNARIRLTPEETLNRIMEIRGIQ